MGENIKILISAAPVVGVEVVRPLSHGRTMDKCHKIEKSGGGQGEEGVVQCAMSRAAWVYWNQDTGVGYKLG